VDVVEADALDELEPDINREPSREVHGAVFEGRRSLSRLVAIGSVFVNAGSVG